MKKCLYSLLVIASSVFGFEEETATPEQEPSVTAPELNGYLQQALTDQNWWAVVDYADILGHYFSTTPFAQESDFVMGEAYFKLGQLELANECFTNYLNQSASARKFEDAIAYKFSIAEQFAGGLKKPLFGSHKLPKWVPAKEDALKIYEEVITTLPHSEMAASSLIGKAKIQAEFGDYKPSLETLDLLIRRFPKHDLAASAHLEKVHVLLMQCKGQDLDPDLIDLAQVNLRKFRLAFPREPRIAEAELAIGEMQEIFAKNLLETGKFFQKTKKVPASILYYNKVIEKYPLTQAAKTARGYLDSLEAKETS